MVSRVVIDKPKKEIKYVMNAKNFVTLEIQRKQLNFFSFLSRFFLETIKAFINLCEKSVNNPIGTVMVSEFGK